MQKLKSLSNDTFLSLRQYNYRLYFIGQGISLCGTWMQTIAQSWLVLQLTHSGTALGLVTALQFLPILLFGPFGGVLVDRFSKRKILYFTQTAAGILALILGILVATGTVRLWMVDILALLLGFVNTIDNPTRQTFVHEMVPKELLTNAVTLNSSEVNLTRAIGPAIAGALIAGIGLAPCFIINAVSYIAVLIMLARMDAKRLHIMPSSQKIKGQLKEGFAYVLSSPILLATLAMLAIIGTLSYEFNVSLPLLAHDTFHGDASTFAALTSSMGLGAALGGLYAASRKRTTVPMLIVTALLFGASILASSIAPTLPIALILMFIVGVFSINILSIGNVILQLESRPEMRGRVMSLWTVAFLGSTPIGGPVVGWIAEHVGARWGLGIGGIAAIMAGILGYITLRKMKLKESRL